MLKTSILCSLAAVTLLQTGCASIPKGERRVFLDSSTHENAPPDWVKSTRITWESEGKIHLRSLHSVRGDERVNGCFDLARLDSKETLLSEIADDVKGTLDNAQTSISESAQTVLGKARTSEYKGKLTGIRVMEQYFERYKIADSERVDCYVLTQVAPGDYDRIKRSILEQVTLADPRIKEAITKKHIDFFKKDDAPQAARLPAGKESSAKEVAKQD
ncbi:MAG: hypothetical protein H7222_04290 [Methylotenera sp.]|nr:hypothetical protein [Oligoflexia bacterium]